MIQVRFNGVHTLLLWSQDWETDSYCFDKRPYFCVITTKEARRMTPTSRVQMVPQKFREMYPLLLE